MRNKASSEAKLVGHNHVEHQEKQVEHRGEHRGEHEAKTRQKDELEQENCLLAWQKQ